LKPQIFGNTLQQGPIS